MGFIDTTTYGADFYNVIKAVGNAAPNMRDDVMMVQYMLRHLYVGEKAYAKPSGEMAVDGICGHITINWILTYQKQLAQSRIPILVDGRVDRIRDKTTFTGSISKTKYTLFALNSNLSDTNPKAYRELPMYVPLSNPATVPPPSNDVPFGYFEQVPATGGI